MKKKGFTLIELLAVIVILSVILVIAVPAISSIVENAQINAFKSNEKMLLKAAKTYISVDESILPTSVGNTTEITLENLQAGNYIGTIKAPQDKTKNCNGYVTITKIAGSNYDYTPYLNCQSDIGNSTEDGLVTHYKFDDFQEPTENLIRLSFQNLNIGQSINYTGYKITKLGDYKYELLATSDIIGSTQNGFSDSIMWYDGKPVTISAYIHENYYSPGSNCVWGLSREGYGGTHLRDVGYQTFTFIGAWGGLDQSTRVGFRTEWLGSTYKIAAGSKIVFENFQAERKSYATPFVNGIRGGIVKDYSGKGNFATLDINTPKWETDNRIGGGNYRFNGVNNGIEINHNGLINNNSGSLSACLWANPSDSTGTWQGLVQNSVGKGSTRQWGFVFDSSMKLQYWATINDVWGSRLTSNTQFTKNNWYNICIVHNHNSSISFYVNGELDRTTTITGSLTYSPTYLTLGKRFDAEWYNGVLDNVRVYNRVLSADEIKQIYNSEK